MKRIFYALTVLAIAGTACTKEIAENSPVLQEDQVLMTKIVGDTQGEFQQGSLLVKLDEATASRIAEGDAEAVAGILAVSEADDLFPALLIQPKNAEVARKYGLHRWYQISFDENTPLQEAAAKAASLPSVVSVQYNSFLEPVTSDKVVEFIPAPQTKMSPPKESSYGFHDPYLPYQWNLVNTGDKTVAKNAVAGADVGVRDAWRLTGGDPSVIVAVFDCAVNSMHEDLVNALWVNQAEVDGDVNVDDDGNGFIDDKYGFNFVGCTKITKDYVNGLLEGKEMDAVKGSLLNWTAGSGHGTHVAGIIGAENGNDTGVSSIAGGTGKGDGVRLMTCQIFEGSRSASDAQNAAAFIYAADNGACIAQCSYGNSYALTSDDMYINGGEFKIDGKDVKIDGSPLENAALKYFLDPANSNHESLEGNIAVFAAGNHRQPYSSYPGALPYVISVTAFGADYLPGGYTNYGPGCKIAAPGGEYFDENNYGMMILSTGVSNAAQGSPGIAGDQNYVYMQGTSMACPHVSGVVALGISYAKKLGKTFSREDFTSLLLTSVNDIDQYLTGTKKYYNLSTYSWTDIYLAQYRNYLGTGAVDAWKFLMAIEGTPSVMVKTGEKAVIDLDDHFGEGIANRFECKVTVDADTRTALGLTEDPVIKDGKLELTCTALGSGKITISSETNIQNPFIGVPGHGIGKMEFSREISIVSRPFAASNGGWF